jgi:hypothetical protein
LRIADKTHPEGLGPQSALRDRLMACALIGCAGGGGGGDDIVADRELRMAKAWLYRELRPESRTDDA